VQGLSTKLRTNNFVTENVELNRLQSSDRGREELVGKANSLGDVCNFVICRNKSQITQNYFYH